MRLAVIGTFHGRYDNTLPLVRRVLDESTRPPDEFWLMGEDEIDMEYIWEALDTVDNRTPAQTMQVTTPREGGSYAMIPYSLKINTALDLTEADTVCYLDNNSMPDRKKYGIMAGILDGDPYARAVYCGQYRTGFDERVFPASSVVTDAFCVLNYTQVMHEKTADRWTLNMRYADPDVADGLFWRDLHKTLGPFHPAGRWLVLDEHHIPESKAVGV